MPGISPFRPNNPVQPELFVGRDAEIQRLRKYLHQTAGGNPVNFLITGERGIGKSSLLNYITALAERRIVLDGEKRLDFLVISTDVNQNTTPLGLVEKINLGLSRKLAKSEPAKDFLAKGWAFLQRVEAAGMKISAKDISQEIEEKVLEEFAYSLSDTVTRLCDPHGSAGVFDTTYDGVLVIIDEADQAAPGLQLGAFLKTLAERLNKNGCDRLMLGLGGLPALRDVLNNSHKSSLRVFDQLFLERLSSDEIADVVKRSLVRAHDQNGADYTIDDDALDLLVGLADGIPHFIQEFGHAAFEADSDYSISETDVMDGAMEEHGAIDQIGSRYFRDTYEKERTANERRILRAVAAGDEAYEAKASILAAMKEEPAWFDDTIRGLVERGDLVMGETDGEATYGFESTAFEWWIERQPVE